MSVIVGAQRFTDTGQLTALDATATIEASAIWIGPWIVDEEGESYVEDLGAAAVPATAILVAGRAYAPDGRAYVTTEAVDAADEWCGSVRVRTDGAVRVVTAAVEATDVYTDGWARVHTGESRMGIGQRRRVTVGTATVTGTTPTVTVA